LDHFSDGDLTDYVRGLASAEQAARLREHLAICRTCAVAAAFYDKVSGAAFVPPAPVPEHVVARAKALFRPAEERQTLLRRVLAQAAFSTAGGWALEGVRSAVHAGTAKHAVYQWENFSVVLRSELQSDSVRVSLVGQIADQREPHGELDILQVRLVAGRKTVERTECNRLGEFALSFVPAERLHLEIDLPQVKVSMKVPLTEVNPQETIL
jgi:anti-sigma factor RsiW